MAAKKHKRRAKKSLAQVHRAIKQAWGRLEKSPAWKIGDHTRLKAKIKVLEKEERDILGTPFIPGRG